MKIHHMSDGRVVARCGSVFVDIPPNMEAKISALMTACLQKGAADARANIRAALGVGEAIEAESQSIYANLQPDR